MSKRVERYIAKKMNGVAHVTLDPEGPGVVRIHLIPPSYEKKFKGQHYAPSVAIINGSDIIPVNISWAILLNEFIYQMNTTAKQGEEIPTETLKAIVDATVKEVSKVYRFMPKVLLKRDLNTIVSTLCKVARGENPGCNIRYMTLKEYEPYMKAPHRMDIMVSAMEKEGKWHCNQKCLLCYAAGQCHANTKEMTTAEIKQVIDKLREIGVPQITFTGGEPTMRDDLVELVEYAQWFVTRLNTNGRKMTPELCAALKEASLDSVQFTLYSHDPAKHNLLVGVNGFEDTVRGIKNAVAAGLNVSINTPLCTGNADYVETLKFARELGVRYVTCSGIILTGNATTDASKLRQLTNTELYDILFEAVRFANDHGMEIAFTSPGWLDEKLIEGLGLNVPSCGACLSNMAITPSGEVVPCQSWLSDNALGNILTDPWKMIWNSAKCVALRQNSACANGTCPLKIRAESEKK